MHWLTTLAFRTQLLAWVCFAFMGVPAMASASPEVAGTEQVTIRLQASHAVVQPGQTLLVSLVQRIAPDWHTYWQNPGDSGEATRIDWTLPAGAQAGPILWPAPTRIDVGPLTNYGYSNAVSLLTHITLPNDLQPGQRTRIAAQVSWLVCKEECIPQEATVVLDLPVASAAQPSTHAAQLDADLRALPQAPAWPVTVSTQGAKWVMGWPVSALPEDVRAAAFFPQVWGQLSHHANQVLSQQEGVWQLALSPGDAPAKVGDRVDGVLVVQTALGGQSFAVSTVVQAAPVAKEANPLSLWLALVLALAGGVALNLMPCVFPVLSIKAFGLVKQASGSVSVARRHGLAYTAGVLVSFAALAVVLIALKAAGHQVGWGFQFQSPVFVAAVAGLLFVVGLSLSGVFTLGNRISGWGSHVASQGGYGGSFFSGMLAAVVATPCTAPFMGAAIAFALGQPALPLLAVFLALGLGLALPYLLLTWWPALQRWLPKPGVWMETFKQALAFPMYGAAVWLVWVIAQQSGAPGVLLVLTGLLLLGLAAWAYARTNQARQRGWRLVGWGTTFVSCLLAVWVATLITSAPATGHASAATAHHEPYSPERLSSLRAAGKPVFVNLTAAWCISCLVNEQVALNQPEVRQAMQDAGVTYLKGDWTQKDPQITALLAQYGRSGVPLYLYFSGQPQAEPVVLPQLLTPGLVLSVLKPSSIRPT